MKPGIIPLTINSFQGPWDEFQFFFIATISPKYYTLTTGPADIVGGGLSAGTQSNTATAGTRLAPPTLSARETLQPTVSDEPNRVRPGFQTGGQADFAGAKGAALSGPRSRPSRAATVRSTS